MSRLVSFADIRTAPSANIRAVTLGVKQTTASGTSDTISYEPCQVAVGDGPYEDYVLARVLIGKVGKYTKDGEEGKTWAVVGLKKSVAGKIMNGTGSRESSSSGAESGEYRWFRCEVADGTTLRYKTPSARPPSRESSAPVIDIADRIVKGNRKLSCDVYVKFKKSPSKGILTPVIQGNCVLIGVAEVTAADVDPAVPTLPEVDGNSFDLSSLSIS